MTPARPIARSGSAMTHIEASRVRAWPSRVMKRSPGRARRAEHRQAVGTVRRDLDVEHLIVEAELFHDVGADGGVAVEEQQARLVLLAETELALGAEDPLRFEAVHLLGRHGAEAWQRGAGGREGRPDPAARVGGAAHDAEALRAAAAHRAQQRPCAAALAEFLLV